MASPLALSGVCGINVKADFALGVWEAGVGEKNTKKNNLDRWQSGETSLTRPSNGTSPLKHRSVSMTAWVALTLLVLETIPKRVCVFLEGLS